MRAWKELKLRRKRGFLYLRGANNLRSQLDHVWLDNSRRLKRLSECYHIANRLTTDFAVFSSHTAFHPCLSHLSTNLCVADVCCFHIGLRLSLTQNRFRRKRSSLASHEYELYFTRLDDYTVPVHPASFDWASKYFMSDWPPVIRQSPATMTRGRENVTNLSGAFIVENFRKTFQSSDMIERYSVVTKTDSKGKLQRRKKELIEVA